MTIINAKIDSTYLGIEDHGIFTCFLHLSLDGYSQGFGGYFLRSHPDMISKILQTVKVEKWEDLPGKYIRVTKGDRINDPISGIGHITENLWYYPEGDK